MTHEDADELWRHEVRWTLLAFRLGDQLRDIEANLVAMQSRLRASDWSGPIAPPPPKPLKPRVVYTHVQLQILEKLERIGRIGTQLTRFHAECRSALRYYDDRSALFLR